jgi:hypothetical protein
MSAPRFHIVTSVWGYSYTQAFVDVALPSMLSPGNLPALSNPSHNLYQILTTAADRATIEASPAFHRLCAIMPVQFNIIELPTEAADRHKLQSYCNRLGIMTADAFDAAIVFYNPDVIVADGGMRSLERMVAEGKRAINVLGIRMIREQVLPLLQSYRAPGGEQLTISPRQLISMAVRNLHPLSMMHFYDAPGADVMPSAIFWKVGDDSLIARCFHLHPMCVYPRVKNAPFSTTIDDDYLKAACPNPDDEHVVLDSDAFCACEMSSLDRFSRSLERVGGDADFAGWAKPHAKPHHLELFCHRISLRGEHVDETAWQAVAHESDEVVGRIVREVVNARLRGE